jgi:hypothetical protein
MGAVFFGKKKGKFFLDPKTTLAPKKHFRASFERSEKQPVISSVYLDETTYLTLNNVLIINITDILQLRRNEIPLSILY